MERSQHPPERRRLTVMFTDLVDSTGMATGLDPEDWHEILDAYQHTVAGEVQAHGGTVSQFQGDGVVAYFGWPEATDTASRDAVSAGLAVAAAVGRLGDGGRLPVPVRLAARVGIHTGLVVVAGATAGGVHRPADVFGETPNLAARLQALAGPGQVAVSDVTAATVQGWFEMDDLGPTTLKGVAHPVRVHLVSAPTAVRSRLDARALSDFVGRHEELSQLQSQWDGAGAGSGGSVVVSGEAGIGKSRLVRRLVEANPDRPVISVGCDRRDRLSPLQPFAAVMGAVPANPAQVLEWLAGRVAGPGALLVVEDVHWADQSTLDVVAALEHADRGLMRLLTTREDVPPGLEGARHLRLAGLGPADATRIVSGLADLGSDAAVSASLVGRAGGVPLFLEELARSWAEADYPLVAGAGVPESLAETISARLDRLGSLKDLAEEASVIGAAFDVDVLAALTGLGTEATRLEVEELGRRRIVEPEGPPGSYRFVHALVQEAAYESLLRKERRRLHGRLADVLAGPGRPQPERPEIVAAHLGRAGRAAEAVAQWERASRRAARRHLFIEASAHLDEALSQLAATAAGPERDATETRICIRSAQYVGAIDQAAAIVEERLLRAQELARRQADPAAQVEIGLTLAVHYQAVADYPAAHRSLDGAELVGRRIGEGWLPAAVGLVRGPLLVWEGERARGQQVTAVALTALGLGLDDGDGVDVKGLASDVVVGATVVFALGEWLAGRPRSAERWERRASAIASAHSAVHAQCLSWTTRALIHQLAGDLDGTARLAGKALELADDRTTAQFRRWAAALLVWAGRQDLAAEAADGGGSATQFMRPYLLLLRAERETDGERALDLLDEAVELARRTGERFAEPELLRLRSSRLQRLGRTVEAEAAWCEAVAEARRQGAQAFEARLLAAPVREGAAWSS